MDLEGLLLFGEPPWIPTCASSQSGVPTHPAASPRSRNADSRPSPRPVFYSTIRGGWEVLSSGEGGTDRPTPHPNPHLGCAAWGLQEQGEKRAGQRWESTGKEGPSASWRSDDAWGAQGRLGMWSGWGRGREDVPFVPRKQAGQGTEVSQGFRGPQGDPHTECWGLGSGEVWDGLSEGPGPSTCPTAPMLEGNR